MAKTENEGRPDIGESAAAEGLSAADDRLDHLQRMMARARRALYRQLEELEAVTDAGGEDTKPAWDHLWLVTMDLLEHERKADDASRKRRTPAGGGTLDLDAARSEVCRRLDRLRSVAGRGDVP